MDFVDSGITSKGAIGGYAGKLAAKQVTILLYLEPTTVNAIN